MLPGLLLLLRYHENSKAVVHTRFLCLLDYQAQGLDVVDGVGPC